MKTAELHDIIMLIGLCVLFGSVIAFLFGIERSSFVVGLTVGLVIFAVGGVISVYRD